MNVIQHVQSELGAKNVRIIKPHWKNPVESEGCGLAFSINCTVDEIIANHRRFIINLTHYMHFLQIDCVKGQIESECVSLDSTRDETDMIWHTDALHREKNAVSFVVGSSNIPTGVCSKPILADICAKRLHIQDALTLARMSNATLLRNEPTGDDPIIEDGASDFLGALYQSDTPTHHNFWREIEAINAYQDIFWDSKKPSRSTKRENVVCLSRNTYHAKGYTNSHYSVERKGKKQRIMLEPDDHHSSQLASQYSSLTFTTNAQGNAEELLHLG